jgi:mycothiol synthase
VNQPELWSISEFDEVVALLNRASPEDRFEVASIRAAVVGDPDYDPNLLLCVREGGKIVGAIAAEIRRSRDDPPESPVGHVKLLAVAPESQRRGIGGALLDAVERQFIGAGVVTCRIFADTPTYLRPGVDFRLTSFVCFLLRRGYTAPHNAVNMIVDLPAANLDTATDETRLKQSGIEFRRLARGDAEVFREYLGREWGWTWQCEAMLSLQRDPISTHLALRNGDIVGWSCYNIDQPGHFGPMGVNPEFRRSGIGAVLLKRCLADLRDEGRAEADIQWVGPITFYAREVGATLSRCFWQFEREL